MTAPPPEIHTTMVGTAGHIDHGKSTLVRALTGIDPDRLPEEKAREMTIDLGFAPLRLPGGKTVGVIDVPGHERFVKNMVAGATSIDVGLLIVDANEGVMPQTREHLEIMQLLGIARGLVVLTKADTAGPEMCALAEEDARELVRGSFLEGSPIVAVSAFTGAGLPRLQEEIERACLAAPPRPVTGPFRMPIQRVFSAKGFGTVVTGVPLSGACRPGDQIEIAPLGKGGKVRGIQAYRAEAASARAGHSSALNLADLDWKEVHRGMVAIEPGAFAGSTLLEVTLAHLPSRRRPLRHLAEVRVHAGTAEVLGKVALLEGKALAPGEQAKAQLRLDAPLVTAPGDRFIIRRHEETQTLGGGIVLGAGRHRLKAGKAFVLEGLARKEAALLDPARTALLEETLRAESGPLALAALRTRTGLSEKELAMGVRALEKEGRARPLRKGAFFVHATVLDDARKRLLALVDDAFRQDPLRVQVETLWLRSQARLPEDLFPAALEELLLRGYLRRVEGDRLERSGRKVELTPAQEALRADLLRVYHEARYEPPTPEEAAEGLGIPKKRHGEVRDMVRLLLEEKALVSLVPGMPLPRELHDEARALVLAECDRAEAAGEDFSAARIRDALRTTRKWLIPLLESFDALGVTLRRGSTRVRRR